MENESCNSENKYADLNMRASAPMLRAAEYYGFPICLLVGNNKGQCTYDTTASVRQTTNMLVAAANESVSFAKALKHAAEILAAGSEKIHAAIKH